MSKEYSIGVMIGRFQVHELHEAHRYVIDQVVDNHKKAIIFLGVPKVVGTKKNPLDFDTRKRMIQAAYPETVILSLPDQGDDTRWAQEIDKRVREIYPIGEVLLYGGRDSFIPYYKKGKGSFDTKELEQHTYVSGTEVRKIVSETVKNSPDFRAGVIYQSYNQYPRVHPCVDVAIFNSEETKILMVKRPFEDGYRFLGGFCRPTDSSYVISAKRKVREDAGINLTVDDYKVIGSSMVDDWRYRSEEDKIITTFFKARVMWGMPQPSDDISEISWFDLKDVRNKWMNSKDEVVGPIVNEHKPLFKMLIDYLQK